MRTISIQDNGDGNLFLVERDGSVPTITDPKWQLVTLDYFNKNAGSGGGSFATLTGVPSDNAALLSALNLKGDKTTALSQFAATTSAQLASIISDETGSGSLVFATSPTLVTPALGTPSTLVGTNITGTAAGLTAGNVTTNANLTGEVTSVGNAATLSNSAVIGKVLTGLTTSTNSTALATDTIVIGIGKLQAQINAGGSGSPTGAAGGDLGGTYPNPTINNSAVIGKVLTGLSTATSSTALATDSIVVGIGKIQAQFNTGMSFGPIFTGNGTSGSQWGIATDTTATSTSTNLITSGAVFTGLLAKFPYLTPTSVKVSSSTAAANDFVLCNANGTTTINFPITPADKTVFALKMVVQSGSNTIPFQTTDGSTINTPTGPTSGTLSLLNQGVVFEYAVATNVWYVICDDLPLSQLDLRYVKSLTTTGTSGAATFSAGVLNIPQYTSTSYTFSTGLTNASNTITNDVLTGKSGGQVFIGGTGTTDTVTIVGTSGAGSGGATAISFKPTSGGSAAMTIAYNGSVNFNNGIALNNPSGQLFLNGNPIIEGKNDVNTYFLPVGTAGSIIFRNFADNASNYTFGNTGNLSFLGNLTLSTAGSRLFITEGSNAPVGQTTLVAGAKAITITGLTASSRAFVQLVTQAGTSTGVYAYSAVCTTNTLTITAETVAGILVSTDTSVLNYFIIN